jgi:hypothetical protein
MRSVIVSIAIIFAATSSAIGQPAHPQSLTPEGGSALSLAAQARRTHLLGSVDLYVLAVYTDGDRLDPVNLASASAAKVLRIEILFKENIRRPIAIDWRRELVPTLEQQGAAHLRGTFAPVRQGDVVLVEYVPEKGTTVRVNKAVAVSGADHELMLAFLDHWIGQRPVSEEMKQELLGP